MATIKIDTGDLEQQVADALVAGVRQGLARIEREFGPVVAAMLRSSVGVPLVDSAPHVPPPPAPVPYAEPRPAPVVPVAEPGTAALRPKNRKRTTEEIAAIAEQIRQVIARSPWLSAAEIGEALGITTTDLEIPLRLLTGRDARGKLTGDPSRLVTTGVKKATRYALLGTPPPKAQRKR